MTGNAGKLGGITARVATCKAQIDAMGAWKQKATTVLSSSKYPAGTVLADFESVYVPQPPSAHGRQQVRASTTTRHLVVLWASGLGQG